MGKNVFSIPIFFIVFRETLEAAIIVSTLLGLVEQIVRPDAEAKEGGLFVHEHSEHTSEQHVAAAAGEDDKKSEDAQTPALPTLAGEEDSERAARLLMRKLRIQASLPSP